MDEKPNTYKILIAINESKILRAQKAIEMYKELRQEELVKISDLERENSRWKHYDLGIRYE